MRVQVGRDLTVRPKGIYSFSVKGHGGRASGRGLYSCDKISLR